MAKGDDLEERLIDFAVRMVRVRAALPKEPVARPIRDQLLRCGTSPAPSYAEARSAESQRDFVHKLKVVLKELNETRVVETHCACRACVREPDGTNSGRMRATVSCH